MAQQSFRLAESFIDSARDGINLAADAGEPRSACVFGADSAGTACAAVSDYADSFSPVPVPFICDTRVPGWVDSGTLAVAVSADGSSADVLPVVSELSRRGARTFFVAPAGPVTEECLSCGVEVVEIPASCGSPEGYALGAAAAVMRSASLLDCVAPLENALVGAERLVAEGAGLAEEIAGRIRGRVPAVYSASAVSACSRWWKAVLGRSSGDLAFFGEMPEFDHNELVGWSDPNVHAPELLPVILRGSCESLMVGTIVGCMAEVLVENGRESVVVDVAGADAMETDVRGFVLGSMIAEILEGMRWRSSISSTISRTTSRALWTTIPGRRSIAIR